MPATVCRALNSAMTDVFASPPFTRRRRSARASASARAASLAASSAARFASRRWMIGCSAVSSSGAPLTTLVLVVLAAVRQVDQLPGPGERGVELDAALLEHVEERALRVSVVRTGQRLGERNQARQRRLSPVAEWVA